MNPLEVQESRVLDSWAANQLARWQVYETLGAASWLLLRLVHPPVGRYAATPLLCGVLTGDFLAA